MLEPAGPTRRGPQVELFSRLFGRESWWEPVPSGLVLQPRQQLAAAPPAPSRLFTCTAAGGAGARRLVPSTSSPRPLAECGVEILDQIVGGLDPDRQAHQVGGHSKRGAGHRGMGHPGRVLDQRLHPAERLTQGEQPRAAADLDSLARASPARNDTMPPNPRICLAAISWPG